jgi:hypothetical protein
MLPNSQAYAAPAKDSIFQIWHDSQMLKAGIAAAHILLIGKPNK